jgi:hypothetical protein
MLQLVRCVDAVAHGFLQMHVPAQDMQFMPSTPPQLSRSYGLNTAVQPTRVFAFHSCRSLRTLELSDNDNLSGSLPSCFLTSDSLLELQLAGLSRLRGPLPVLTSTAGTAAATLPAGATAASSSASMPKRRALLGEVQQQRQQGCGFGKLQYINMAGVIGDQEPGLTGAQCGGAGNFQKY